MTANIDHIREIYKDNAIHIVVFGHLFFTFTALVEIYARVLPTMGSLRLYLSDSG
jgi:hypothetical protein